MTSVLLIFIFLICIIAYQYSSALGNGLSSLANECTTFRPVVCIPIWVFVPLLYSLPSLCLSVHCLCCHVLSFHVSPYNCIMCTMWVALHLLGMSCNRSGDRVSDKTAAVGKLWVDTRHGLKAIPIWRLHGAPRFGGLWRDGYFRFRIKYFVFKSLHGRFRTTRR
jgi:hypothetical protein